MNYYIYGSLLVLYLLSVFLTSIFNHTFDNTHFTGSLDGSVESEEGLRNRKFAPIKHKFTVQSPIISDSALKSLLRRQENEETLPDYNTSTTHRKLKSSEGCQKTFPESCSIYPYIKYWTHEFSERDCYVSPAKMEQHDAHTAGDKKEHKFVAFRHDSGGWNNIRCAFESIVIYALATGRTLVLPPKEIWAWLRANENDDDNMSDFDTFVNLKKLEGILHIVSMDEFLELTAYKGLLKFPPPENVTVIPDGPYVHQKMHITLWKYLYEACFVYRDFDPVDVYFEFALRYDPNSKELMFGHVTESTMRFTHFLEHRKRIAYLYNETVHKETAVFFPASHRDGMYRETGIFYHYIYFEDPNLDATMKRVIRDRTHYNDEIMCSAGRIVKALLEEASTLTGKPIQDSKTYNPRTRGGSQAGSLRFKHASFHAMHVRHRAEFAEQFQEHDKLSPELLLDYSSRHLDRNVSTIIYIATDVNNMTFFDPLREMFQLRFFSDFMNQYKDGREDSAVNFNHLGMIEQMICASADTFVGTRASTFSDHIMRLRGYYEDHRDERSFTFDQDIDFTRKYHPYDYILNTPDAYLNIDAKYLEDISTHSTKSPEEKRGDDDDGLDLNPDEEDDDYDTKLSFMPSLNKRVKDYNDDTVT